MAWARSLDLYLNVAAPIGSQLVRSAANLAALERPSWIAGDKFNLRLNLRQPGANGTGTLPIELDEGDEINVAGVKAGTDTLLFLATAFTNVAEGDADPVYQAELDLNTVELLAALGDDPSMLLTVDVEVRNAANTERRTLRFAVTVLQQVYTGAAPAPTEIPDFPAAESIALKAPVDGAYRIKTDETGSYFQLKNATTAEWHTLFAQSVGGVPVLVLGPGES